MVISPDSPASPQDATKTDFAPLLSTFDEYVTAVKDSQNLAEGLTHRAEAFQSLIRLATKTETR